MKSLQHLLLPLVLCLAGAAASAQDPAIPIDDLKAELDAGTDAAATATAGAYRDAIAANQDTRSDLESQLGAAAEDAKADLQTQLDAAVAEGEALVERQRVVLSAMDDKGLDTEALRQALFDVTGLVTDRGLSAGAAVGIVGSWMETGKTWITDNGPSLLVQLVIFLVIVAVFRVLSNIAAKAVDKATSSSKLNISSLLRKLFVNTTRNVVFFAGVLIALQQIGIPIGPLLGAAGILGFVIGFALQDTLSNFAAGVMILMYRPYDVGDVVSAGGVTGKVEEMTLVSTTFLTPDNQLMIVPNGSIWGGVIQNVTANDTRRVDLVMGCGYDDDLDKTEQVIREVVEAHELVLAEPAPTIKVHELADSSVNFVVRPWCKTSDYWDVYWDLTKALKQRFDAEGLNIPFPQRDVHIFPAGGGAELTPAGSAAKGTDAEARQGQAS